MRKMPPRVDLAPNLADDAIEIAKELMSEVTRAKVLGLLPASGRRVRATFGRRVEYSPRSTTSSGLLFMTGRSAVFLRILRDRTDENAFLRRTCQRKALSIGGPSLVL
jgi:hypothetical protein